MKKIIFISIISSLILVFSNTIDFKLRTMYVKADTETREKLNPYNKMLEDKLNSYDWEFPLKDFEHIETIININIEKSVSDGKYNGMVTISCGLTTKNRVSIPFNKDIYNEQEVIFSMDLDADSDLETRNPSAIETILKFYIYRSLGEIFDKLSYTDQKNFKLEGEYYYLQLYEFENLIISAQERKNWRKRLEIINDLKQNKHIRQRKLNAFIYNASLFINKGKSNRARYFVKPIYKILKEDEKVDKETFFKNNYNALSEIFALEPDTTYMNFLIKADPAHKPNYLNKIKNKSKVRNTEVPEKNKLPDFNVKIPKM
ncbi:MAG: hypothetical protein PF638_14775 [Candidatus Delongbacteria bacterium]|jgi:hypothetical protein|nr:hypothetical protein [Candidatus Delongbacteria bacterium]